MNGQSTATLAAAVILLAAAPAAHAQDRWRVDFENGAALVGYNDVRIPGDTGTKFSLSDDLASDTAYYWRVRVDVRVAPKHVVSALAAPLALVSSGSFDRPAVAFAGAVFAPGVPVRARYVFNSYRLTYRYEPVRNDTWTVGVGLTLKIRDAVIRLESDSAAAEKKNLGAVPLVNFKLERRLGDRAAFLLEGDALAAPQGRAEDIFAGVLLHAGKHWSLKAGYRLLEGGADNDQVYTFALVHYLAAGVVIRF
jgi:hypothetical protein